jgi:MoxR-like ATPase
MATKFNEVESTLEAKGYNIVRDPSCYDRYTITNRKSKKSGVVLMRMKNDEIISEVKKLGVDGLISKYDVNNKASRSRSTKPAKVNVNTDLNNLKLKTKSFAEDVVYANDETSKSQVVELKDQATKPLDFNTPIPKCHNGYYFPDMTDVIVRRIAMRRNIWIGGETGTGKSEFVMNLARFFKQKVVRVNFSLGTTEGHLVGKFIVKDGSTKFVDGVVPMAMKNGWWLLLDELDYASPEHLSVLQPVLEGDALILVQNENETIVPHENFRVFATANTKGRGDSSQSYTGTNFMNMAFVDRWSIFEFEYTKHEKSIVTDIIGKDTLLASQILKYFANIRKSVEKNEIINAAFSTRRMIHFCEALAVGESLAQALDYEILLRYDKIEADVLKELAFDIWDKEHYMKGWKLGDTHAAAALQPENNTI